MKALAIIPLLACSGCMQLLRFTDGSAYYDYPRSRWQEAHPYRATKTIYDQWFMAPANVYGWFGRDTGDPIGSSVLTLMWPVSVVDLPCEAALDTVMCIPDWILADPEPVKSKETKEDE